MKKYINIIKMTSQRIYEYRGMLYSIITMQLLGIGVKIIIWHKLFSDYESIGDYDFKQMVTYYLLGGLFGDYLRKSTTREFEEWIRKGNLSNFLIKPLNPILYLLSKQLSQHFSILFIRLSTFFIPFLLFSFFRNALVININTIVATSIIFILANTFLFIFYWLLGSMAFWMINLDGLRNITKNLLRLLQGRWFPFDLAPLVFQNIMKFLPFQYILFFPIQILLGQVENYDIFLGIEVLSVSILLVLILAKFVWNRGLKKYDSVGI